MKKLLFAFLLLSGSTLLAPRTEAQTTCVNCGGGGAGTPGGSTGQTQYNSSGAFAGITGSAVSGANEVRTGTFTATQFITSGTAAGCLTLNEAVASGLNTDVFCAPSGAFSNASFILPAADGTAGQFLKTDASGNLTFAGSATAPITFSSSSVIACATCATTTNGGAISGTAPISVSAAGAISLNTPFSGMGLNRTVAGTTDTILAADCFANVTYTSATAVAVTLPQATGSFAAPCPVHIRVTGAGVVTITPTTSTIDALTSIGLDQFTDIDLYSDSANWQVKGESISVKNAALSVNTLQVQPSIATAVVTEAVIGSDTNVGWTRKTKGTGSVTESPGSNSTSCYTVANATLTGILRVDCTNSRVGIGSAAPATTFDIKGLTQWNVNGLLTLYNNITTAGQGQAVVQCITSQKAETNAADTNVLTCTPASAVGTYRLHIVISVTSATSGVIGWTATWTDSNGNAQTPTNLALTQTGVAAPALTFTTSAAGNYHGEAVIDVNNAGTGIVIKWTGGGTSAAKVTATVERLI